LIWNGQNAALDDFVWGHSSAFKKVCWALAWDRAPVGCWARPLPESHPSLSEGVKPRSIPKLLFGG
jgi:hypothetical protein